MNAGPILSTRGGLGGLDQATELADQSGYRVVLYREGLEAHVSFRGQGRTRPRRNGTSDESKNLRDANRRATGELVRIAVANRLRRHVVLTWAGTPPEVDPAHRQVGSYLRSLRSSAFGGRKIPFAYVMGLSAQAQRLHVHLMLPATFSGHFRVCWPHGRAKVRNADSVDDRRRAARYLGHHFDDREPGRRRYRAPHGIAPKAETIAVVDRDWQAVAILRHAMGADATEVVRVPGFAGTPTLRLSWNDAEGVR